MNYLDRNILPRYQERLDLAASELNDMEDIFTKAINELAGRIYIISNMIPYEERSQYAEELVYPILDKLTSLQTQITIINNTITEIQEHLEENDNRMDDFERRLNALDDAAARKDDLNECWYRLSRREELVNKEEVYNKVQTIDENSTSDQYPSAACVYTLIGTLEDELEEI